ncbi:MAG: DUF4129 domain-containing protein [Frankiales bacterium]|nr:DUF4129 domain-containing protein [Frankiales bacterium]
MTLGRDEAQRLARLELAKPEYHTGDESWVQRAFRWVLDRISQLLDVAGGTSPLGWFGVLGLLVVAVLVVVVVRRRIGSLRRSGGGETSFDLRGRRAADLRAEAERFAAAGAWAEAVRARLRAIVRDVEERDLIDARPGRTADEVATDAGRALPAVAGDLRAAARLFDDVWYGGRPADADGYARMVAVDDAVRRARPAPAAEPPAPVLAAPR